MDISHWNELTEYQKNIACDSQNIPDFIKEHWNELSDGQKNRACDSQNIPDFIKEHWNELSEYQKNIACASQNIPDFIKEPWNELTEYQKALFHEQPSLEVKKSEARKYAKFHGLRVTKRYLYAFRNHDNFGCGVYNKVYKYTKGQYYKDWHCDGNPAKENSFGYGIWPKGNTAIRVRLEDFCVSVNRDDGKARVWGFEIC